MSLDPAYITNTSLEPYFVNKQTGAPLAGGLVYFYQDSNRTNPKLVYELTGSPPNYTYTALPNPMTLSGVGTAQNGSGQDVSIYYYPYDANGDLDLYYVVVTDANGVVQFTRQAWPNEAEIDSLEIQNEETQNQISNTQFMDVLFNNNTMTALFTGSSTSTILIAPDWKLVVSYTGSSSVIVTRNPIAGSSGFPTNPPYTITFTPSGPITSLWLVQTLPNTPDVWSPANGGTNGFISFGMLLGNGNTVTVQYVPSNLSSGQTIFNQTNTSGGPAFFNQVTQLNPASNPQLGGVGSVDIRVILNTTIATTLSSVQAFPLNDWDVDSAALTIPYQQMTYNRQEDYLFHYYNPLLQQKRVSSYLIGWDFPLNPAQALGKTVSAFASGTNTSNYVWDQTICFQTANSGVSFSEANSGALVVTGAATGQFALVQYLDATIAPEILRNLLSVNIAGSTNISAGLTGTISLWYTTSGSLPTISSPTFQSLVATLDANGKPATLNGGFVEVPRGSFGDAKFTLPHSSTSYSDVGFSGWNLNNTSIADTATYFAIVVGFASMVSTNTVTLESISLVPGPFPTRPGVQSQTAVINDCQRYYECSFQTGTAPAGGTGANTGEVAFYWPSNSGGGAPTRAWTTVLFREQKRSNSPNISTYNPLVASGGSLPFMCNLTTLVALDSGPVTIPTKNCNYFTIVGTPSGGSVATNTFGVHWTSDARFGVV